MPSVKLDDNLRMTAQEYLFIADCYLNEYLRLDMFFFFVFKGKLKLR